MVVKNCAALQKDLARSELFGHCRGAFTGATESREGLIAAAEGGTLFLDEVGELSLDIQGSLLRVLETSTYRRIGAKQETRADVRFAFATNRDLAREVEQGRFLEALYHRINVFRIQVPCLRERLEDVPLLVEHFLHKLRSESGAVLSARAISLLKRYSWPGNVRELRNVIERSLILSDNGIITEDDLPEEIAGEAGCGAEPLDESGSLRAAEQQQIAKALRESGYNRTRAASRLGCSRKTLYRKLRRYGMS
jgi:two-component system NtrC family response regulator